MSVQFGRWNFDLRPIPSDYINKVAETLALYGPDSNEEYSEAGVKILYHAFCTTKESRREKQPHVLHSGTVITWDGRLDNRPELIEELRNCVTINSTDVEIVAAAYEKWGTACFARLIGDWALSIWNPAERSLLLTIDPIGPRHLYYLIEDDCVIWSTILDPLVLLACKTFALCEEYVAGWFSGLYPAAHLTPFLSIHAVPPSSWVLISPRKQSRSKYWDFDSTKRIIYRSDADYEHHFRSAFATAVRRRLRSDHPILAELSGGMDSSPIVCMADRIIERGEADTAALDTISWFDDAAPNWGERRYVDKVEKQRGCIGCHIDYGAIKSKGKNPRTSFASIFETSRFAATPFAINHHTELLRECAAYMTAHGHRVVLSGIGGESATGGGVPTPTPELQNLFSRGKVFTLARQLGSWAVKMRRPRLSLLWEAVREFLPVELRRVSSSMSIAPWLCPAFSRRNRTALHGYPRRVKLFEPLPSFQDSMESLDSERRFMAYCVPQPELLREIRFPYLDRDLLEFMYAIPREQVVRVGERRSLMRRALVGIVPDELLNRKKRAVPQQDSGKDTSLTWHDLVELGPYLACVSLGVIDADRFMEAIQVARCSNNNLPGSLIRTFALECWLRHLLGRNVLARTTVTTRSVSSCRSGLSSWSRCKNSAS